MTGPTGSGKTTTLYGGAADVNKPEKKIITAEDPVEYNVAASPSAGEGKAGLPSPRFCGRSSGTHPTSSWWGKSGTSRSPRSRSRRPHRAPGLLDAAHQRCPLDDHPAGGDGGGAVPGRLGARLAWWRSGCEDALQAVQAAHDHPAEALRENGFSGRIELEAYRRVGAARCGGGGYTGGSPSTR